MNELGVLRVILNQWNHLRGFQMMPNRPTRLTSLLCTYSPFLGNWFPCSLRAVTTRRLIDWLPTEPKTVLNPDPTLYCIPTIAYRLHCLHCLLPCPTFADSVTIIISRSSGSSILKSTYPSAVSLVSYRNTNRPIDSDCVFLRPDVGDVHINCVVS